MTNSPATERVSARCVACGISATDLADTQPANATGRAGKQGGQNAFGKDVENVFGLNRP